MRILQFSGVLIWFCFWLTAAQVSAQTTRLQGSWLSDGYGLLVELNPGELHLYELTAMSCIPSRTARVSDNATGAFNVVFASGNARIRITRTDDVNTLSMHTDGAASDIILHRVSRRPDACNRDLTNSPEGNYRI